MFQCLIRLSPSRVRTIDSKHISNASPREGGAFSKPKTTVSRLVRGAVVFCSLILLFAFSPIHAQSVSDVNSPVKEGLNVIEQPLGLPTTDIRLVVARVIRSALALLGIVFLILVLYAGYLWMTAGGNEEKIGSAKKILINATVGLIIILTAYGIVTYVMSIFTKGNGGGDGGGGGNGIEDQNFVGSGALGQIIKDHYPGRNQTGVPRNSKIIITFYKPIDMQSVAIDTNKSSSFGDCVNIGKSMNWENDCDSVQLDVNHINVTNADTGAPIRGASVLASYANKNVYTIVMRPYDPLGSDTATTSYKVRIGKGILVADGTNSKTSLFAGRPNGADYYEWQFITDTKLDTTPPHVVSVFPDNGETQTKDSVIQIKFDKAIDPTGVQGDFANGNDYYTLAGGNVFLKTGASTAPLGTMRSVDGYRMLEFTPSKACGTNACGGTKYCLSVCDAPGANCQSDSYQMLLKAAQTFSLSSFESIPFSGIMDVSGNALDGNVNNKVDSVSSSVNVFPDMQKPDNYFWNFTINNKVDLTAPFITQVTPGVDAPFVEATDPLVLSFSKAMRFDPFYSIDIDEKPTSQIPLCFVPRITSLQGPTTVSLDHCPFLDTAKHYYYPMLDSKIEDVHFNCIYPGKGPLGNDNNNKSFVCSADHPEHCCPVTSTYGGKATCCNGVPVADNSASACVQDLKVNSL